MRRRAFTLIELIVAIALLAIIVAIAGVIFRIALSSYRLAAAQSEIMSKLRVLTAQLDSDFAGFRTDAPVYMAWAAQDTSDANDYISLDRVVFFSRGAFRSMGSTGAPVTEGSDARISYMLAHVDGEDPNTHHQRILGRSQHIMAPPRATSLDEPNDAEDWVLWHNDPGRQYDDVYYRAQQWLTMEPDRIREAMQGMTGMDPNTRDIDDQYGIHVSMADPRNSLHLILCQGVGQFRVQGWYQPSNVKGRWVPDVNDLLDCPCVDIEKSGSLLYFPRDPAGLRGQAPNGILNLEGSLGESLQNLSEPLPFVRVPGLGRALRFTFTLYDSKGLIEDGMTFTHVVNLDR